jgi:hypothetical protein
MHFPKLEDIDEKELKIVIEKQRRDIYELENKLQLALTQSGKCEKKAKTSIEHFTKKRSDSSLLNLPRREDHSFTIISKTPSSSSSGPEDVYVSINLSNCCVISLISIARIMSVVLRNYKLKMRPIKY